MKHLLALALLLLPLSGFSQKKEKDPYAGLDKRVIIEQFGKPTEVRRIADKKEVLIYKKEVQSGPGTSGQVYVAEQTYMFSLNEQGKVVASTFKPASQPEEPIIAY